MRRRVGSEERDLVDGYVERVVAGIEGDFEGTPNTVVQAAMDSRGVDAVPGEDFYYVLCYRERSDVGLSLLEVVRRKAVETGRM